MSPFSTVLLATFVAVVIVQVIHRVAGAVASILWTLGLLAYGVFLLQDGAKLVFLGVQVQLWHFATFMACMLAYNGWVLARALKSRSR